MILIVEDEAISRRALASLLNASGYETVAVGSAEAALDVIDHDDIPEYALVDLDLPGMNGIDLIHRLEDTNPDITSVLITASTRERMESLNRNRQPFYLRKPLDFDRLLNILHHNSSPN